MNQNKHNRETRNSILQLLIGALIRCFVLCPSLKFPSWQLGIVLQHESSLCSVFCYRGSIHMSRHDAACSTIAVLLLHPLLLGCSGVCFTQPICKDTHGEATLIDRMKCVKKKKRRHSCRNAHRTRETTDEIVCFWRDTAHIFNPL